MRQRHATAILERIEGLGVLVEFQQRLLRVFLAEIRIGRRALVDQQRLALQLGHILDGRLFGRHHPQRHLHVGRRKIHHAGALLRLREIGQNDVHLAGFQVFHPVGCLGDDELHLVGAAQQIPGKGFRNFHIEALALAVAVDVAERRLVAEHADADAVGRPDLRQAVIGRHGRIARHHAHGQQRSHHRRSKAEFHFSILLAASAQPSLMQIQIT